MSSSNGRRILVVDPDSSIRSLLSALLRRQGIEAECAGDSETALLHARSQRFAAVIVEPRMEHGDTLLAELCSSSPDGDPNVIVATTPDATSHALAQRKGVRAVLLKPFHLDELFEVVAACCDGDLSSPS